MIDVHHWRRNSQWSFSWIRQTKQFKMLHQLKLLIKLGWKTHHCQILHHHIFSTWLHQICVFLFVLYCFNYCKLTFYVNKHTHKSEKSFALNTCHLLVVSRTIRPSCTQMWYCNYMLTIYSMCTSFAAVSFALFTWML